MRILIAGGLGFVGGRVAQHLHQIGHQVTLGSRKVMNSPNWLPDAEVVKINWNDVQDLVQICQGVDVLIHAAGMNAQDCAADPVTALEFNGVATTRLVAAARQSGVRRLIYLSTAHVYASPLVGSISEDTWPRNLHPYATSHIAGENAVLEACQHGHFDGIVLRLSNAYGAAVHKQVNCWMLLVNDLCRQAVETGKMVLRSSGMVQRDFVAISEICRVIEQMSYCDLDSAAHGVFNVGSGRSQSALEMAELIQNRCKLVLGFEPQLHRLESYSKDGHKKLEYKLNKLEKIGLKVRNINNDEIDALLSFCRASFS